MNHWILPNHNCWSCNQDIVCECEVGKEGQEE